jgi:hypothetical protein
MGCACQAEALADTLIQNGCRSSGYFSRSRAGTMECGARALFLRSSPTIDSSSLLATNASCVPHKHSGPRGSALRLSRLGAVIEYVKMAEGWGR